MAVTEFLGKGLHLLYSKAAHRIKREKWDMRAGGVA